MDLATLRREKLVWFRGIPLRLRELVLKDYVKMLGLLLHITESPEARLALDPSEKKPEALRSLAVKLPLILSEIVRMSTHETEPIGRRWFGMFYRHKFGPRLVHEASPSESLGLLWEILELNDAITPLKKKLQEAGIQMPTGSTKPSSTSDAPTDTRPTTSGVPSAAGA